MKKILFSAVMTVALLISGFSVTGFTGTNQAEAATSFELGKSRSGYFTNYVASQAYSDKYSSKVKTYYLRGGRINSTSSVKGTYKVYIQTRKNSKSNWKTVKTINATKNGLTKFESPNIPNGYSYRFYSENPGTKKRINFSMSWVPWAN
ncbi:hypothetical protein [Priestia flexa]|uniref:hypothetical protein n=1 Tax=Priestia flexa TaxID=86664 RepID=UPI00077CD568|nr:hypothetical protein [Priestia flexa]MED4587680.1 hypothetical protein [Priestia flexa]